MLGFRQRRSIRTSCAASFVFLLAASGTTWAEADGPDAWRVVDVASNDTLNARMGPGTNYPVIGQFAHDARGLTQVTCVPLVTAGQWFEMSEAERTNLPPRWCLMQSADYSLKGWVAQRYLAEDHVAATPAASETGDVVEMAERLVRRLYNDHLQAKSGGFTSPLNPSRAGDFFTAPLAESIARGELQADPLFDAQDSDITDLHISLDEERPMFRGLITVNADFRNFGHPRRAVVRLRVEDGEPRIIRIEHEGWSFG
ncbi:SH3 domain-containing protein [Chelativorans sp. YIM 93263]|uniref:SH3 domain-containing protein n=1 Tax=Chelativorans sp. YIM 93263 TaxID=2906648 RepID=UPI0023794130|nr:hypothetical protein [Chelativorans sp. YIM 93263]